MHGGIVMLKQEKSFTNCCHKVGSTELSRMYLTAVALRFPFTGTKEPSPNHEKRPYNFSPTIKFYSWHYALGQVAFSWHLTNLGLTVGLLDVEA